MKVARLRPVAYAEARERYFREGAIALCRPATLLGHTICRITGSVYSHATLLGQPSRHGWAFGETLQGVGGRLNPSSMEVERYPGFYDVFWVRSRRYDPEAAWDFMFRAVKAKYSGRGFYFEEDQKIFDSVIASDRR